jgi:hypothetical protein
MPSECKDVVRTQEDFAFLLQNLCILYLCEERGLDYHFCLFDHRPHKKPTPTNFEFTDEFEDWLRKR